MRLPYYQDFGNGTVGALGIGSEDIVDARGDAFTTEVATVPDGLTAVGGGRIDGMSGGIGDMNDTVAGESFDGDGAVVVGAHRIGESIDLVEGNGLGVGGCATIDLQSQVGAHIDLASALVDTEGDDFVGEEGAVGSSEMVDLFESVG